MKAKAYYNEIDQYAVAWLRNLIDEGLIAPGDVDDRPIQEVQADDLKGYTQHHFFAGIAGWSLGLRLAGWPDDRPVWTGSAPCQPFSEAGKRKGIEDERHLWPSWMALVRECRPPILFGEQVASAVRHGWADIIFDDLEEEGYTCGASVLPACSVGAPHIRQRFWFVGYTEQFSSRRDARASAEAQGRSPVRSERDASGTSGTTNRLAHAASEGAAGNVREEDLTRSEAGLELEERCGNGSVANPTDANRRSGERCQEAGVGEEGERWRGSPGSSPWGDLVWLPCTDGKQRPTGIMAVTGSTGSQVWGREEGQQPHASITGGRGRSTQSIIQPLAHGVPSRVAKLRAIGNSVVPQVAAAWVQAVVGAVL